MGTYYFINNTVINNNNAGYSGWAGAGSKILIGNIIANNGTYGVYDHGSTGFSSSYNNFYNNPDGNIGSINTSSNGNISVDPQFVSNTDFNLLSSSPCIDAGDPSSTYNDPDGTRNDMGYRYFSQGPVVNPANDLTVPYIMCGSKLWSTGETTSSIIVNPLQTTTYTCNFNNGTTNIDASKTINVDNVQEPLNDDTLAYCNNQPITLDAGTFFNSYLWSNAIYTNGHQVDNADYTGCVSNFEAYPNWDSTSTSQTIQVNQSGTYYVKVNSANNCEYLDSVVVSMLNPSIVGDTTVQAGDTAVLLAKIDGVGFLLDSYDTTYLTTSDNIQNALDNANSGTVIMLAPGTYYENIVWPHTSNLVLSSSHGPEQTVIDGSNNQESVIYVGNGQSGVVIDNLHITNGYGSLPTFHNSIRFGGGVLMDEDVRGVIKNCLFTHNGISPVNEYSGALFVSYRSEVYFINNTVTDNYGPTWWRSGNTNCMMGWGTNEYGRDGICMNNIMYNNAGYGLYNQYGLPKNSIHIRNNNSNQWWTILTNE